MYVNKKDIDLSHITNNKSLMCPELPLPILTPYFDCQRRDNRTMIDTYIQENMVEAIIAMKNKEMSIHHRQEAEISSQVNIAELSNGPNS